MKKFILILLLATVTQLDAGWFDQKDEKQRIQNLEQQLAHQQYSTGTWKMVAGVIFIGGVILFVAGTAVGSITRRHGRSKK